MADAPPIEAPTAALDAIIRQQHAEAAVREDLGAYLRERGVEGNDLSAMLDVGAERLLVYRKLVHNRMRNTIREFIPRVAARLGSERYLRDVDAFMEHQASSSPYLRDVPAEFVAWVASGWAEDPDVPGYIPDLARHELLDIDVRNDPRGGEAPTGQPLALDRPLRFDGAVRLCTYDYAVHRLPRATEDRSEPDAEPTRLLVYRDATHRPRYLSLTAFASALMHALLEPNTAVQPALVAAAASLEEPLDDDKLSAAAVLFADLAERGICLGAEPAP